MGPWRRIKLVNMASFVMQYNVIWHGCCRGRLSSHFSIVCFVVFWLRNMWSIHCSQMWRCLLAINHGRCCNYFSTFEKIHISLILYLRVNVRIYFNLSNSELMFVDLNVQNSHSVYFSLSKLNIFPILKCKGWVTIWKILLLLMYGSAGPL